MKSKILTILFVITALQINAQVTIGIKQDPNSNALLDLKEQADGSSSKGLLLPRVALEALNLPNPLKDHVEGMTIYNTATSANDVEAEYYVSPGMYYNDGTKWVRFNFGANNWFYMPAISFDTSEKKEGLTKDLYKEFEKQFNAPVIKSTNAPNAVPYIPGKNDIYYYITDYDTSVFGNITIDDDGLMKYNVINTPTPCSYINIVFVLK